MLKNIRSTFISCCLAMLSLAAFDVMTLPDAHAQESAQWGGIVKGIVTDSSGPVIGAAVFVKGSSEGTTTGVDGDFSLSGLKKGDVIVVSIIGYETREIIYEGQASLDVVLNESTTFLDEVVVTALGIKREQKTLSYNVQSVDSEKLTAVKDASFVNSLVGKVAGVQISSGAAGPGSATRVVMRGTKSIQKSNNVLYVIDGVPMYNKNMGGTGGAYSTAVGSESAADINPEDIESVSMLTGPSAAALYGSEAANGVIIINTKRGSEGKTTLTISNSTTFSNVMMLPEMQYRYGSSSGTDSWGAPVQSTFNAKDFFNTGVNVINAVSLSTGNSKNQTYLSASTTNATGNVPDNSYNRYNFTARNITKFFHDKFTLDFGASLILQNDKNMVSQGKYYNPLTGLYLFPRGDDFDEVRLYERWDPVRGMYSQYWPYGAGAHSIQNPYWVQYRNPRTNNKRRYMLNASLKYDITDWLNVTGRVRLDESTYRSIQSYYAGTLTTFCGINGGYSDATESDRTFYGDVIANVDKTWGDWRLIANVGGSINDQRYERIGSAGDLVLANVFTTRNLNTASAFKSFQEGWHDQNQAVFGSAEVGFKNMVFLTLTGRNEWPSQLAFTGNSSYFYWSAGLSAVISSMVKLPDWFTFLKARGSYAKVSSPIERYLSNPSFTYNEQTHNWQNPDTYPAYNLLPEDTRSWEVGLNMAFFNKLTLDVTYYRSNTYHQTIYAPLASSTGYKYFIAQTGNVQNQGVELALGYSNEWEGFSWATNFTYTFNQNKIIELAHGIPDPIDGSPVDVVDIEQDYLGASNVAPQIRLREGGSMSDIYVKHFIERDANGNVLITSSGDIRMKETEPVKVGSLAPKANFGWSNTFGYAGVSLGVVITARVGGLVYSATQGILDYYGTSEASAQMRDAGGIPVNGGMLGAYQYYRGISTAEGGYGAYYLYDATNVRLQELSLNYTLPRKWFREKAQLTVGFVARNLAMIYCKAPFDPEMTGASTSNYYQGVDYFMQPSTRNLGFNVKLQF
ncbi:MAG: SusC/RagA family TonB-linked outer membrane protein [Bacteroidales bacterium]|nr:SusC/RagA family TonB-linked outer membrane protein [Bacteroidales bacterium]